MSGNRLESNLRCSSVIVIVGTSFFELFLQILDFGLVGLFSSVLSLAFSLRRRLNSCSGFFLGVSEPDFSLLLVDYQTVKLLKINELSKFSMYSFALKINVFKHVFLLIFQVF